MKQNGARYLEAEMRKSMTAGFILGTTLALFAAGVALGIDNGWGKLIIFVLTFLSLGGIIIGYFILEPSIKKWSEWNAGLTGFFLTSLIILILILTKTLAI